jgi:hypothetical protein
MMQEGAAAEEPVQEPGTVMMNNRYVEEGPDGRMYYVDDNTPADGISMGMRRGGSVQAFKKGGKATIADMAQHYGHAQAFNKGGKASIADLARHYGMRR